MKRLDDDEFVREQYRSTTNLESRTSVWLPDAHGHSPQDVALKALADARPARLLEVGCGTGTFAVRCAREVGCEVVALDSSPEMVAATRAAGVEAVLGDVRRLQFTDASFDAAVAAWMLYHVADLDLAIAELARVLRPSGRLVAITNGRDHLAELWEAVGTQNPGTSFSRENGAEQLERRFVSVRRHDIETRAVFSDRMAAATYLATLERSDLAERLPEMPEPLIARGTPTVFVADEPRSGRRGHSNIRPWPPST
jgi:ubiquinone/menaquinone biosynthesis C-methylase UbiE